MQRNPSSRRPPVQRMPQQPRHVVPPLRKTKKLSTSKQLRRGVLPR